MFLNVFLIVSPKMMETDDEADSEVLMKELAAVCNRYHTQTFKPDRKTRLVREELKALARKGGKIVVVDFGVRTLITAIAFSVEERDGELYFCQEVE